MEKHTCPLCQKDLDIENKIKYIDYSCTTSDDHYFAKRIKGDEMIKMKVRFTDPDGEKLYFKINYDLGGSQVWTKSNDNIRTEIQSVFIPDFSDITKLKNKIRTYLVFS